MSGLLTDKGKVMRRPLTNSEWGNLKSQFPQLDRNNVTVIDDSENIKNYNCIAWALGCADRWFAPPVVLSAFKDWFGDRGASARISSANAGIDGWGLKPDSMEHTSRSWQNDSWTSKLGSDLCITHDRQGLTGGVYGNILTSFQQLRQLIPKNPLTGFLSSDEKAKMLPKKLASQDISDDEKLQFESAFQSWKSTWFQGNVAFSSYASSRAQGDAFKKLVQMDTRISIPLVIEKLADPDNFISLVLHEQLEKRPHLLAPIVRGSLESEQARCQRVVKLWLHQ
ncbi:MAG TPA: hypothetical protein VKU38_11180 [Ktedonobacteraceae bacterium]|nr:hypothetical protein [Ktedonobacteraceae bacterium]